MRPKLLKSFFVVALFWFVATTLYWSFADPAKNHAALQAVKGLFPFLPINLPESTTVLNAWRTQLTVLAFWTAPVLILTTLSTLAGFGFTWRKAYKTSADRDHREMGKGNYRGVTLTLGDLPLPPRLPADVLDLGSDDDSSLARLTEKEKAVLGEILGTLSAAPDAYAGPGIESSLLEHAIAKASEALEARRYPGLSAIAAAAHELGKITAFVRNKVGDWDKVKDQDREAAKILGQMDSWWALPSDDRMAVMFAVKFKSNPKRIPDLDGSNRVLQFTWDILNNATRSEEVVVAVEKAKTLERHELPDVLFDAFLQGLPALSFQNRGLPAGVRAVAWKQGNRVYMIEIELRERVMSKLDSAIRGALSPHGKDARSRLQPFTRELLKALDARGWLVREVGKIKLDVTEALWTIKAGKLEFKGVIVIDVPEAHMDKLPEQDSFYEVSVLGPLFTQPGVSRVSMSDMNSILKPMPAEKLAEKPAE